MTEDQDPYKQSSWRKREILNHIEVKTAEQFYCELRNNVIEEVAQKIETLEGFGSDTMASFAIWVRNMKSDTISK